MKIILINGSSVPLYEQIKNAIKENIFCEDSFQGFKGKHLDSEEGLR